MPKRSPASPSPAADAPPILDDGAVATIETVSPPAESFSGPVTVDEFAEFHSVAWKGLDQIIVKIIDGTATVDDYETAHRSGFIGKTLEKEIVRITRVADQRRRAVSPP